MNSQKPYSKSVVLWQGEMEGETVPEQALLIEYYTDIISITQGHDTIHINYESVKELCKLLKPTTDGR